jgi:glycosyltransferase involved in cell wall biosynthesis
MTDSAPLVSIGVTTFNHEKYIAESVRSALGQTHANLQVVVVDDGSTDRTPEMIRPFRGDGRLVYIRQENQGPSAAANAALAACRGKYFAHLSGDDVLHPDRIRRQLAEYTRGPRRVLFCGAEHIDDDGRLLEGEFYPDHYKADRPRAELVERLFHTGCVFFGVTCFTERQVLLDAPPYDPLLLQSQDLDRWIYLIKRYDFQIMPDKLYHYRIRACAGNLSNPTPERVIRYRNELYLIMRRFFDGLDAELCRSAFRGVLINPDFAGPTEYACEQAFLYLKSSLMPVPLLGVEKLYQLLSDPTSAAVLRERYGLTPPRFFELLQSVNVTSLFAGRESLLFVDVGDGWKGANVLSAPVDPAGDFFELTFDLSRFPTVKELAWAPLEGWLCRVRINGLSLRDAAGNVREVGPSELRTNGEARPDGTYVFLTAGPRILLSVGGPLASVTVRGELQAEPPARSINRLATSVNELQLSLDRLRGSRSWRVTAPLRLLGRLARGGAGARKSA